MKVSRQPLYQPSRLDADGTEVANAAEKFGGGRAERLSDLLDGRQRRVTAAALHRADIVWGQVRAFRELLEGEAERLSPPPDHLPEVHGLQGRVHMPASTTIGGVANQRQGVVSSRMRSVRSAG